MFSILSLKNLKVDFLSKDLHEETLDRVDIREMSHANYHQLASEVAGELPVFDEAYDLVVEFYKSLPWNCRVGGSPC